MMNDEIALALSEAVSRKADAELRAELDCCFKTFTETLRAMYSRYDAAVPDGVELYDLRKQAFDAMRAGARLHTAEKFIRSISE